MVGIIVTADRVGCCDARVVSRRTFSAGYDASQLMQWRWWIECAILTLKADHIGALPVGDTTRGLA